MTPKGKAILFSSLGLSAAAAVYYFLVYRKSNQSAQSALQTINQVVSQTSSDSPANVTLASLQKLDWYNQGGVHISPLSSYLKNYDPSTGAVTHVDSHWKGQLISPTKIIWTRDDGIKDTWTGYAGGVKGLSKLFY